MRTVVSLLIAFVSVAANWIPPAQAEPDPTWPAQNFETLSVSASSSWWSRHFGLTKLTLSAAQHGIVGVVNRSSHRSSIEDDFAANSTTQPLEHTLDEIKRMERALRAIGQLREDINFTSKWDFPLYASLVLSGDTVFGMVWTSAARSPSFGGHFGFDFEGMHSLREEMYYAMLVKFHEGQTLTILKAYDLPNFSNPSIAMFNGDLQTLISRYAFRDLIRLNAASTTCDGVVKP